MSGGYKDREKERAYQLEYRRLHKNYFKKYKEKYVREHSGENAEYQKEFRKNHKDYFKEYQVKYKKNNKEKLNEYLRNYQKNNKGKSNKHARDRRKVDLKYNLNNRIRVGMAVSLKGKKENRCWETLVNYTLKDLIKRLNKTMPINYTWEDFLNGKLHIDHIIPITVFNFTKPEHIDFKHCWALKNLRLLPAKENQMKHSRLNIPFQPALKI